MKVCVGITQAVQTVFHRDHLTDMLRRCCDAVAQESNGRAITEYRVAITQGSNPPSCSSASSVGTAASTEFTGLSPNRDYMVVVYAKNGLGDCSEAATSARVITRATPGVLEGARDGVGDLSAVAPCVHPTSS